MYEGMEALWRADGKEGLAESEVRQMNALVLAYVGDTVYDLMVRTYLAEHYAGSAHKLHQMAIGYVSAHAQSDTLHRLLPELSEEEAAVYRRGRNTKSPTVPKNADVTEYRAATGLEALIGFLYLAGRFERLSQIGQMILQPGQEDKPAVKEE